MVSLAGRAPSPRAVRSGPLGRRILRMGAAAHRRTASLRVLWGEVLLSQLYLPDFAGAKTIRVTLGTKTLAATLDANGTVTLKRPAKLKAGSKLTIAFRR